MQAGVAQEPGRSRRLHRRCGTDGRDKQQSRPGERPTPAGANRAAAWYRQAKETKCGGTGVEKSESADSTDEVGEPAPRDPAEGSGGSGYGASEGQMTGTSGLELISTRQRKLAELAQQDPQLELTTIAHHIDLVWLRRSLPAHAQGRRGGGGRRDGGRVRGGPGGEPDELARTVQVGSVSSAAGASGTHPEAGQGGEDETAGHPDAGGQGLAARGADGAGADLRAGLCGLFVRVPARTRRAPGAGGAVGRADVAGRWLGDRFGHPELLRRGGSGPSKGLSGPTGARTE